MQLVHDARAVHDTAALKFKEFHADGQSAWIVAAVRPAPASGSASVPGAHIKASTGEFVAPRGAQPVVSKSGTWEAIARSSGAASADKASYSWPEQISEKRGLPTPEDYYSPFSDGGTIAFRYQPNSVGIDQFQSVRLIFPDWAKDVASASAFVESHRGLLENGEQRAPEVVHLQQLLKDKNRFLAVEAFRELSDSGHLDGNLVFERITHAAAPQDAVLTYLVLTSRGGDELSEQVNAAVRSSADQKKLESIALAAFSALLFRSNDSKAIARSRSALQHVHDRARQLRIPMDPNSYLSLIFNKSGIS